MTVAVRTAGDPLSMVGAVRGALRAADPQLSMMRIRTQTAQIDEMMMQERMFARVSSLIGVLAAWLVAIGLYGTLAFSVARRTSEIGIRMAFGASGTRVLWMVLRESLWVACAGLLVGLPAALGLGRLIASHLYGVEPNDPSALIGAAVLLAAVCATAGYLPARRAARLDPIRALHSE
jgi:ABC-type antimicrobial peptide transport system permease subunit